MNKEDEEKGRDQLAEKLEWIGVNFGSLGAFFDHVTAEREMQKKASNLSQATIPKDKTLKAECIWIDWANIDSRVFYYVRPTGIGVEAVEYMLRSKADTVTADLEHARARLLEIQRKINVSNILTNPHDWAMLLTEIRETVDEIL